MTRRGHPRLPVPGGAGRLLDGQRDPDPVPHRPDGVAQAGLRAGPSAGSRDRAAAAIRGTEASVMPVLATREPAGAAGDPPDAQVVVQLDEVRPPAGLDPAAVRHPEQRRGVGERRRDRDRERHPLADQVAHRRVERDDRPGQRVRARRASRGRRARRRPGPPIVPRPVAHPGERQRVAHEDEPVGGLGAQDDRPQRRVDVVARRRSARRTPSSSVSAATARPGSAVVDAGHRVEQVGRRPRPPGGA